MTRQLPLGSERCGAAQWTAKHTALTQRLGSEPDSRVLQLRRYNIQRKKEAELIQHCEGPGRSVRSAPCCQGGGLWTFFSCEAFPAWKQERTRKQTRREKPTSASPLTRRARPENRTAFSSTHQNYFNTADHSNRTTSFTFKTRLKNKNRLRYDM